MPLSRLSPLTVALAFSTPPYVAQDAGSRDARGRLDFEGRLLVSVQDADMVASAYVDGALGPREGRDTLAVDSPTTHQGSCLYLSTDRVKFHRLDTGVRSGRGVETPLVEVPARVFSEFMRD